jgi:hypothetical protein
VLTQIDELNLWREVSTPDQCGLMTGEAHDLDNNIRARLEAQFLSGVDHRIIAMMPDRSGLIITHCGF